MSEEQDKPVERRKYIRHPICLPLEYEKVKAEKRERAKTLDLSYGGLLFLSRTKISKKTEIVVMLPFKDKTFKIHGSVARCERDTDSSLYEVGIEFTKVNDAFKVKLVEQLHLIEEYRSLRSLQLDREMTLKEASEEWIEKYSEQFQKMYW